ncbi:hypothetical protein DP145_11260 [Clostridium tetani]|uniref:hypothetical protein n=1 Tax=Clostridium tetani TaxID=1513 RepID=UPI00100B9DF8|nr:hypothetical protein [Clostridium tetani]RXI44204.1 hypothetical protein DP126_11975 [Clostridium tetani]RXM59676.1 hypothetical protein DP138_12250 [Clostridium tetani]RXM65129.1 hypothetical protein DP145_11260 [Clostridium tetani]
MNNEEKKEKLKELVQNNEEICIEKYYSTLEGIGDYKSNYKDYMTTAPINVDIELSRLSNSNYEICAALLTMLLREDYFSNGSFVERYSNGQVIPVIERMIELL